MLVPSKKSKPTDSITSGSAGRITTSSVGTFRKLKDLDPAGLDAWLLENFAFIGPEQQKLDHIRQTPLNTDPKVTKTAYRPPEWNRAAILEAIGPTGNVIGMVDVKGFGNRSRLAVSGQVREFEKVKNSPAELVSLRTRDHSDGLMSAGEAVAETSRQMALQKLFEMKAPHLETVETYAILIPEHRILKGADASDPTHSIPAALYLRQAHFGRLNGLVSPDSLYTDQHGGKQKTRSETAVDMGGVIITDPSVKSRFDSINGKNDPQYSRAWADGHDTARNFVDHRDSQAISGHLRYMLEPIEADYEHHPKKAFREAYLKAADTKLAELRWYHPSNPVAIASGMGRWKQAQEFPIQMMKNRPGSEDPVHLEILSEFFGHRTKEVAQAVQKEFETRTDAASLDALLKILRPALEPKSKLLKTDPARYEKALLALSMRSDPASKKALDDLLASFDPSPASSKQIRLLFSAIPDANFSPPDHYQINPRLLALAGTLIESDDVKKWLPAAEAMARSLGFIARHFKAENTAYLPHLEHFLHGFDQVSTLPGFKDTKAKSDILKGMYDALKKVTTLLNGSEEPAYLSLLKKGIPIKNKAVHLVVTDELGRRTDPQSLGWLEEALNSKEQNSELAAIAALACRRDPSANQLFEEKGIPILEGIFNSGDLNSWQSASFVATTILNHFYNHSLKRACDFLPAHAVFLEKFLDAPKKLVKNPSYVPTNPDHSGTRLEFQKKLQIAMSHGVEKMSGSKDPRFKALLKKAIESDDVEVVRLAATELGKRNDAESQAWIEQALASGKPSLQYGTMLGLVKRRDEKGIQLFQKEVSKILIPQLKKGDEAIWVPAAETLAELLHSIASDFHPSHLSFLEEVINRQGDIQRNPAFSKVNSYHSSANIQFYHRKLEALDRAIREMGDSNTPAYFALLQKGLSSVNEEVSTRVTNELGRRRDAGTLKLLEDALAGPGKLLQMNAIAALALRSDPEGKRVFNTTAAPKLLELFKSEDPRIWVPMAEVLAKTLNAIASNPDPNDLAFVSLFMGTSKLAAKKESFDSTSLEQVNANYLATSAVEQCTHKMIGISKPADGSTEKAYYTFLLKALNTPSRDHRFANAVVNTLKVKDEGEAKAKLEQLLAPTESLKLELLDPAKITAPLCGNAPHCDQGK